MAIKRSSSNPVVVLDVVVAGVERDAFQNRQTGEVQDRGRKLTVQTGSPFSDLLEVRVGLGADDVVFEPGESALINVEYSEYEFTDESGRTRIGSIMRYHSHVSAAQVGRWVEATKSTQKVAAAS